MKNPTVSILIVNYNGRALLEECLSSIRDVEYPKDKYEVILVDNRSSDDSVSLVSKKFPWVKLIEATDNLGFTGGNNLAYQNATGELIVLLNTDTRVDKNWLSALVQSAAKNPEVGLFASRLRFAVPYIKLKIQTKAIQRSEVEESIDFSPIGVMIENVTSPHKSLEELIWYGEGFYDQLPGALTARWTKKEAIIYLPFPIEAWQNKSATQFKLTLHGYSTHQPLSAPFELSWGKNAPFYSGELKPQSVKQVTIDLEYEAVKNNTVWFIQNAGNVLLHDGHSKDRGSLIRLDSSGRREFYEPENEYYLQPKKITAICGASCMVRRAVIDEVGFLDGNYFMYYEDVELSMRAWKVGWDILYVPESLVYHRHKATTSQTAKVFFMHLAERNHLFFSFTHYPISVFMYQISLFFARYIVSAVKSLVCFLKEDLERYERWRTRFVAHTYVLRDLIKIFPHLVFARWQWHKKSKRSFAELERMMY